MTIAALFGGMLGLAEQVVQTLGVYGLAGLWALKFGVTALLFRGCQKRAGTRLAMMPGWMTRQMPRLLLRRRIENGTNGR